MNQVFKIIKKDKNPEILVITPLLPGHKISSRTKVTLGRNKTPIIWITSTGKNNVAKNVQLGIDYFYKQNIKLLYYFPLDNDVVLGRGVLDKLKNKLNPLPPFFAFSYASFEFQGAMNRSFPAEKYDIKKLLQHNYISSNSLFRFAPFIKLGGLVTDDKYIRLLDWCYLLKLLHHGYIGKACPKVSFVAISDKKSISNRDDIDYSIKHNRVISDFVKPIIELYNLNKKITKNE